MGVKSRGTGKRRERTRSEEQDLYDEGLFAGKMEGLGQFSWETQSSTLGSLEPCMRPPISWGSKSQTHLALHTCAGAVDGLWGSDSSRTWASEVNVWVQGGFVSWTCISDL